MFSLSVHAEEKTKLFNKKEVIIIGLTIVNPAIVVGTLVANTSTFQKFISLANIAYSKAKGQSIAETAISQSTNKDCLIENIKTEKDFCI